MSRSRLSLMIALLVLALGVAAGCGGDDQAQEGAADTTATGEEAAPAEETDELQEGTIRIGYGNNLTGFLAVHDKVISDGARVEVDKINEEGGIGGKVQIELTVEDTKTDPGVAVQVANSLLQQDVDILMLPCNTDFQVAMAAVAQREGTFTLSPCNADPTLVSKYDVYWPVGMSGSAQGAGLADHAVEQGYETAWVLDDPGFLYVHLMAEYFKKAAADRGIEVLQTDTITVGDTNFAAQVTRIQNADPKPDVIMTGLFTPFVNAFQQQLRGAGLDIPIIGTDGMDTVVHLESGGAAANGTAFSTFGYPEEGSALADFYDTMEQETGERPAGSFAALGAASIQVLAAAVEAAGSADPADIQQVLADGLTVDTVLGEIEYPGGHDNAITPVAIVRITDGAFELVELSVPENIPAP